jgi:peptidyl-dipeptidase Dcp
LRAQQASLLGFADYASWKTADQMAGSPQAAFDFMRGIAPAARARAERELADIQQVIDEQQGGFAAQAWDWSWYAEQVRRAKYDLDESQVAPYFALNTVLNEGVFFAANRLFGIRFVERTDIPVYHPDVRVWEIFDQNDEGLALFYGDFFARDSKSGGAWMGNFIEQSTLLSTKPVIYNVCNYQKPAAGQAALLSWDDVITLFMSLVIRCMVCSPASAMPLFRVPIRRVISLNSRHRLMSTGQAIRRCSRVLRAIIRPVNRCRKRCAIKCCAVPSSIKVMT